MDHGGAEGSGGVMSTQIKSEQTAQRSDGAELDPLARMLGGGEMGQCSRWRWRGHWCALSGCDLARSLPQ